MILLNTTFSVDDTVADDFFAFLRKRYVPEARRYGFTSPLLSKVRVDPQFNTATGGFSRSYALQIMAPDADALEAFVNGNEILLLSEMSIKWGYAFTYFSTVLDVVDTYNK